MDSSVEVLRRGIIRIQRVRHAESVDGKAVGRALDIADNDRVGVVGHAVDRPARGVVAVLVRAMCHEQVVHVDEAHALQVVCVGRITGIDLNEHVRMIRGIIGLGRRVRCCVRILRAEIQLHASALEGQLSTFARRGRVLHRTVCAELVRLIIRIIAEVVTRRAALLGLLILVRCNRAQRVPAIAVGRNVLLIVDRRRGDKVN